MRRLYPQGVPVREIAQRLGRSEDAVSERRRTLQLPPRERSRAWSQGEDDLLRAASAAGVPAEALASRLGRPPEQVRRRRRALLGAMASPRAYTMAEDDLIRSHWHHDVDIQQLARALDRSPGSLRLRARKLGCYEPAPRPRWSTHEDAAVRDGYELGLTCAQIALELRGRTASAVAARAGKLGLASYARIWTPDDDRALRILARDGAELVPAARLLARTPDALRARARKLGVAQLRSRRSRRATQRWTSAEDEQLKLHAGLNPAVLAELLDRSPEAVTRRLRQLGLREARTRSPHHLVPARNGLTPGELATVERELRTGGPRARLALARRFGRPAAEILARPDARLPAERGR